MGEARPRKRVFGYFEAAFDAAYLAAALALGGYMLLTGASPARLLAGFMAVVLACGDAFHLAPRMAAILSRNEKNYRRAMGVGKWVTSVTMTAFYVMLWHVALLLGSGVRPAWTFALYALALLRVALCLPRANGWLDEKPPVKWGIIRNIPFLLMGVQVAWLFAAQSLPPFALAIFLSFLFYIPVVLFSNARPMIGMLMLPKTVMYVWILGLCAHTIG